jgi:hypothetical protein
MSITYYIGMGVSNGDLYTEDIGMGVSNGD